MWPGRVSCASALTSSLARFPRAVPHLIALCPSPWRPLAYSQGHLCPAVKGHHCQQVLLPASATESQGGASDPTGPWAWLRAPRPSCSAGLDRLCDLCGVTWTRRKPGALLGAAVALGVGTPLLSKPVVSQSPGPCPTGLTVGVLILAGGPSLEGGEHLNWHDVKYAPVFQGRLG